MLTFESAFCSNSASRPRLSQIISNIGSWNWNIKNNKVQWSDMMYRLLGLEPNEQIPSYELTLSHN
jgi:hypothetical protein